MKSKIITVLIIVICILFFALFTDYIGLFKSGTDVTLDIPNGSNVIEIAQMLKDNSVLRHPKIFTVYSVINDAKFQAGKHTFDKKSYGKIFKELSSVTPTESVVVTIPEGYEQREIASLLEEAGVCKAEDFNKSAVAKNFQSYWFLQDLPEREYQLEGYLFPDTYEFSLNDNPASIIKKMLDNFDSKITEEIKSATESTGLTFDQLITLASIIEREAATDKDFKLVSGIFHNRLNYIGEGDGFLRSCATVQYILKERKNVLSISDTEIDSPYNTYKYAGLPVGPVASPGIDTIVAASFPEKTEYIYFASDANGKLYYAKTYSEHQNNMRKAGL